MKSGLEYKILLAKLKNGLSTLDDFSGLKIWTIFNEFLYVHSVMWTVLILKFFMNGQNYYLLGGIHLLNVTSGTYLDFFMKGDILKVCMHGITPHGDTNI